MPRVLAVAALVGSLLVTGPAAASPHAGDPDPGWASASLPASASAAADTSDGALIVVTGQRLVRLAPTGQVAAST